MECLVISAKKYKFEDEKTKEIKSGLHVQYLDPVMREDSAVQKGDLPLKVPALESLFDKLEVVPGFYELDFRQRPDSKGRPVLTLASARFVCGVSFNPST
jgi:hypothetical protein